MFNGGGKGKLLEIIGEFFFELNYSYFTLFVTFSSIDVVIIYIFSVDYYLIPVYFIVLVLSYELMLLYEAFAIPLTKNKSEFYC